MTNSFFNPTGVPQTRARGYSAVMRAVFEAIGAAFDKFGFTLSGGNAGKALVVNGAGTGLGLTTGTLTLPGNFAFSGAYNVTVTVSGATTVTWPTTGTFATLNGSETFTNKTLTAPTMTAPVLGTPASGNLSNCMAFPTAQLGGLGTGVATFLATPSSANLAAAVTGETGTGALVFADSPTLINPALGTPASGVGTNLTGIPEAGLTLADNTTNNATTGRHGFLKKLDNDPSHFMNGQGDWMAPTSAVSFSQVGTNTIAATPTSVPFTGLTSEDLIIYFSNVSITSGTAQLSLELSNDNGSTWITAAINIGSATVLDTSGRYGAVAVLTGLKIGKGHVQTGTGAFLNTNGPPFVTANATNTTGLSAFWSTTPINAIRLNTSASTFVNGGVITLYGRG